MQNNINCNQFSFKLETVELRPYDKKIILREDVKREIITEKKEIYVPKLSILVKELGKRENQFIFVKIMTGGARAQFCLPLRFLRDLKNRNCIFWRKKNV